MKTISVNKYCLTTNTIRSWLVLLAFIMCGCASTRYNQDFRPGTEFSDLKTYNWRNISSEIPEVTDERLQGLADKQLLSQGYLRTDNNPDFVIDVTLVTRVSTGSSTGVGLSIGLPIGRHGNIGLGGGKNVPNDKQEGVILIDATNSLTNTLIWRGSAEGIPLKDFSLKEEDKLANVLNKLFNQFPPKAE